VLTDELVLRYPVYCRWNFISTSSSDGIRTFLRDKNIR